MGVLRREDLWGFEEGGFVGGLRRRICGEFEEGGFVGGLRREDLWGV